MLKATTGDPQELSHLKLQYQTALHVRSTIPTGERYAADVREQEFFLERLRRRLGDSGVTRFEIEELEASVSRTRDFIGLAVPRFLASERTAILVIHGIGEQNRYETLDQFSRNLARYLRHEGGIGDLAIRAQKINHNDWVEAIVRLETDRHGPGGRGAYVDIYEYYWAPETEDKISYRETISWLIKTTLTPLRMLQNNIDEIAEEPDKELLTRSAILKRELRRISLIYLPVVALLGFLIGWIPSATNIADVLKQAAKEWNANHPIVRAVMTLGFMSAAVMYWAMLKELTAKSLRHIRQQTSSDGVGLAGYLFVTATPLVLLMIFFGHLFGVNLHQYLSPVLNERVGFAVASAVIARVIQIFLKDFMGDVAVYVNSDAKSKNYAARRAVLGGASRALTCILKDDARAYDNVLVAGHSLGSVIAYDTLNELLNRCSAGAVGRYDDNIYATPDTVVGTIPERSAINRNDLSHIKGLITFGSPLDKVHYFFRDFVPPEQKIRAQIILFMRSFCATRCRDYGIYAFKPFAATQLAHVKWLNAWSKQDPVSGMLHFYSPVQRRHFEYLVPVYAHLSYWEDIRFYEFFAEPLLFGIANAAPLRMRAVA